MSEFISIRPVIGGYIIDTESVERICLTVDEVIDLVRINLVGTKQETQQLLTE